MKHSALCAFFFLLTIIGCTKSSSTYSNNIPSPNDTSSNNNNNNNSNNSDTISHVQTGYWSFQMNGNAEVINGTTTECLMSQVAPDSPYQLVMGGILSPYSLTIQMEMPSNVPAVGQYISQIPTNNYNQIQIDYMYSQGSYTYYSSDSITFNIVTYDQTTRAVSATFYGNVNDGFGNISSITNGTITGVVQK
jgi:hypothetical protein